jgi:hypothetical protein
MTRPATRLSLALLPSRGVLASPAQPRATPTPAPECDRDGDSYLSIGCGGQDCNDDPADGRYSHPDLSEICYDGYDNDCDGFGDCGDDECKDSIFCAPTPTPTATATPTPVSGGCTTPGFDGSCPPGTYPNNGMCCSGGCNAAAAPSSSETASFSAESSPSLAPGDGGISTCNCDELEQYNCVNGGGFWDDASCACSLHSPIVLDVAGNGFRLTASRTV